MTCIKKISRAQLYHAALQHSAATEKAGQRAVRQEIEAMGHRPFQETREQDEAPVPGQRLSSRLEGRLQANHPLCLDLDQVASRFAGDFALQRFAFNLNRIEVDIRHGKISPRRRTAGKAKAPERFGGLWKRFLGGGLEWFFFDQVSLIEEDWPHDRRLAGHGTTST